MSSLVELIDAFDLEVDRLDRLVQAQLAADRGYTAIQAIPGVGPILDAVFVAEISDVTRFPLPPQLCCWAGLTPRHRESDTVVRRGSITKQGSKLVRWAAVEAVQRQLFGSKLRADRDRIAVRRDSKALATSPRPANSSLSSTTGCVTGRSVAWPDWSHEPAGTRPWRVLASTSDPHQVAWSCS